MAKAMNKKEMIKELEEVMEILKMDSKEFMNYSDKKFGYSVKAEDTYPFRCGVALSMIAHAIGKDK